MVIDYKNRTILIADGISGDGQKTVTINYDRFDKVTYTKSQEGNFVYMDGTPYVPSVLPEGNSLVPGKFSDVPNVSFYYPINPDYTSGDTFANQMYISPLNPLPVAADGMTVPTEFFDRLIFTNDAGLKVVSIQGNSGSGVGTGEYSVTFNDDIPVGTVVTISGILYNQAFEATEIAPYTIEKMLEQ